jgi:hypothetical protein
VSLENIWDQSQTAEQRSARIEAARRLVGSDAKICETCWWWSPNGDAPRPMVGWCERMELDGAMLWAVESSSCSGSIWIATDHEFGCNQWESEDDE